LTTIAPGSLSSLSSSCSAAAAVTENIAKAAHARLCMGGFLFFVLPMPTEA
jgi:hypothetical protein